jgi:hypothetical protein
MGAPLMASFAPLQRADQLQYDVHGEILDCAYRPNESPDGLPGHEGPFLGNYPQALSYVGLISSGVNLARSIRKAEA